MTIQTPVCQPSARPAQCLRASQGIEKHNGSDQKPALVAAIAKYRTDTASAVAFHDADLTNSATTPRGHEGVMKARSKLLAFRPAEPEAPKVTPATALADRAPRTVDQKDTVEGRETGAGLTALFNADAEGFQALAAANTDPVRDADTG